MSSVVGVAEVLVRPNTTGFEAEATPGIESAGTGLGKNLGKAILAGFAVGGVYEGIKSVVEAATAQNQAFAVLDQTIKNTGESIDGFSASLHDKLEVQARATGVSAEDLAAAMSRLVPATGNVSKSVKDLNTAIGISETFHISLSTAALALAKAETGSFTSLQRYLGLIPKVTTNVDALKARYTALTEGGAKLDATQKAQYASALQVAEAQDRVLTSQNALGLATQKFAGVTQTFANTYQGQFNRLHVAVEQLKVAIGTELVGGLAEGAGGLANYLDKLIESNRVQTEVRLDIASLKGGFDDLKQVLTTLGPPLISVADELGGVVRVAEILGGVVVANKIGTWLAGIGASEATATTSTAVLAGAVESLTAALTLNTEALTVNQGTVAESTIIYDAYGGTLATVTAEEIAAGAAAVTLGGESVVAGARVGLLAGAIGGLKRGLIEYLAVNQGIKLLVPGQKDLGLDFSNNTAKTVTGDNGSPYQKGSASDELYQQGFDLQKAGKDVKIKAEQTKLAIEPFSHNLISFTAGVTAGNGGADLAGTQIVSEFLKTVNGTLDALVKSAKTGETKNKLSAAAEAMLQSLRDGISSDQTDLASIKQNLADAITQGTQAVTDAVNQAKQNLTTIGSSLSSEIQSILVKPITDAQHDLQVAQDKLSLTASKTTLRNLGQEILLPGGRSLSTDPDKAIKQLQALEKKTGSPALSAFIQTYQSALSGEKSAGLTVDSDTLSGLSAKAGSQISNLTDLVNTGKLSKGQFGTRLQTILKRLGITPGAAGRAFGVSGADTLTGLEQGLLQQAGAITGGPQRAGSGLVPSITRPLQTLESSQKQIAADAKEQRKTANDLAAKSHKLLTTIANNSAAKKFVSSLDANPGTASKQQKALTGVTG